MTKTSKFAAVSSFNCEIIEDWLSSPKIRINVEINVEIGKIMRIDTKAIKTAIEEAVKANMILEVKDGKDTAQA